MQVATTTTSFLAPKIFPPQKKMLEFFETLLLPPPLCGENTTQLTKFLSGDKSLQPKQLKSCKKNFLQNLQQQQQQPQQQQQQQKPDLSVTFED